MSTRKKSLPDASGEITEPTEEVLVERYNTALLLLRAAEESAEAIKSFKKNLAADHIEAASFLEFVKLRRQGRLSAKLSGARKLRNLALRFEENLDDQGILFESPLSEKSRSLLKVADAAQYGYDAGLEGMSTDGCPYTPGTDVDAAWRGGHADARSFMLRSGMTSADTEPAEVRPRRSALREAA